MENKQEQATATRQDKTTLVIKITVVIACTIDLMEEGRCS